MRNIARAAALTGLVAALGIAFCAGDAQACHKKKRCGGHSASYVSYGGCYGGGWAGGCYGGGWGGGGWGYDGGWGHAAMPSYQGGMASYQNVGYSQGTWAYDGGSAPNAYAPAGYANAGYAPAGYTPTAYYGPGGYGGGGGFQQGFVQGANAGALGMPPGTAYGGYGPYGYSPYGGGVGQNVGSYAGYRATRGIFGR